MGGEACEERSETLLSEGLYAYLLKNFDQIHEHKFSLKLLEWRKVVLRRMKNK